MSRIVPKISKPHLLNSMNTNWVVVKDHIAKSPTGKQDLPAIKAQGIAYSSNGIGTKSTIPAIVPGTILNTLLRDRAWLKENIIDQDKLKAEGKSIDTDFFDPFFDTNQTYIPDASIQGGVELYTYWYYTEFTLDTSDKSRLFWLNLRGINYTADVFVNGVALNEEQLQGMFLRHSFDLTVAPSFDGIYRLAIRIVPPDSPGTPVSEGNGGDLSKPNIGENITMRHTIGWDWTISIPDRSTGLWDQVSISTTKALKLTHPKVTTSVDGSTATITITTEVYNPCSTRQTGFVSYELEGRTQQKVVSVEARQTIAVTFTTFSVTNARLWWPNGSDPVNSSNTPELYTLNLYASMSKELDAASLSDQKVLRIGMREFTNKMVDVYGTADQQPGVKTAQSRQFYVNGVPVFIRGGNWMGMDTLFRGEAKRYKDEVRMHKEMNLNLIRVWGGGIIERPEFYEACDELGIMVMQEFWFSGEFKFGDTVASGDVPFSQYPAMQIPKAYESLFELCAKDSIQLLRNHASLLFWCAANESIPPLPLLKKLHEYIGSGTGALYDNTRLLIPNSRNIYLEDIPQNLNHNSFSDDGPYGILELNNYFGWLPGSYNSPFNPEIGSLGIPTVESIRKMIRPTNISEPPKEFSQIEIPSNTRETHKDLPLVNESWKHLKFSQYFIDYNVKDVFDDQLYTYGAPKNIEEYCERAQLANYMHYKGLWEGYLTHMYEQYTGLIIWKSQGSWTGVRAKLYDWFLEQNGGYWGVRAACEAIHAQLNLIHYPTGSKYDVNVVNHTPNAVDNLELDWQAYDLKGSIGGKLMT